MDSYLGIRSCQAICCLSRMWSRHPVRLGPQPAGDFSLFWEPVHKIVEKPILSGEKITLRPITAADADAMFASLSDEEGMRLTGTQESFTLEQVQQCHERFEHLGCIP